MSVASASEVVDPLQPDDQADHLNTQYYARMDQDHARPSTTISEYPQFVEAELPLSTGLPQPYVGKNNLDTLEFFRETATAEEYERYHLWMQQYVETRRLPAEELLVILNGITITNFEAYNVAGVITVRD